MGNHRRLIKLRFNNAIRYALLVASSIPESSPPGSWDPSPAGRRPFSLALPFKFECFDIMPQSEFRYPHSPLNVLALASIKGGTCEFVMQGLEPLLKVHDVIA